jgi:hypothetical protein
MNLDDRIDRNTSFLNWLSKSYLSPHINVQRISSVYNETKGYIGCTMTHIKTLETFLASNHDVCIMYEDDYEPIHVQSYWRNIQKIYDTNVDFDVILLAYNEYNMKINNTIARGKTPLLYF